MTSPVLLIAGISSITAVPFERVLAVAHYGHCFQTFDNFPDAAVMLSSERSLHFRQYSSAKLVSSGLLNPQRLDYRLCHVDCAYVLDLARNQAEHSLSRCYRTGSRSTGEKVTSSTASPGSAERHQISRHNLKASSCEYLVAFDRLTFLSHPCRHGCVHGTTDAR